MDVLNGKSSLPKSPVLAERSGSQPLSSSQKELSSHVAVGNGYEGPHSPFAKEIEAVEGPRRSKRLPKAKKTKGEYNDELMNE